MLAVSIGSSIQYLLSDNIVDVTSRWFVAEVVEVVELRCILPLTSTGSIRGVTPALWRFPIPNSRLGIFVFSYSYSQLTHNLPTTRNVGQITTSLLAPPPSTTLHHPPPPFTLLHLRPQPLQSAIEYIRSKCSWIPVVCGKLILTCLRHTSDNASLIPPQTLCLRLIVSPLVHCDTTDT
jgi:hypothetical protein